MRRENKRRKMMRRSKMKTKKKKSSDVGERAGRKTRSRRREKEKKKEEDDKKNNNILQTRPKFTTERVFPASGVVPVWRSYLHAPVWAPRFLVYCLWDHFDDLDLIQKLGA
ncbi:hypothetical protein PoB_001283500 [Plakobranchus ocellatus]|uniref:Uncharacterized protein n=1 Tax=Plakobranchus ocellatus TaxID=259542 RepID=A0AAV3YT70_9GAST|nr:hypothetical protein PoB_001283500 [Plakobranchus ocellatus]